MDPLQDHPALGSIHQTQHTDTVAAAHLADPAVEKVHGSLLGWHSAPHTVALSQLIGYRGLLSHLRVSCIRRLKGTSDDYSSRRFDC